jgi:hypothetical protein
MFSIGNVPCAIPRALSFPAHFTSSTHQIELWMVVTGGVEVFKDLATGSPMGENVDFTGGRQWNDIVHDVLNVRCRIAVLYESISPKD